MHTAKLLTGSARARVDVGQTAAMPSASVAAGALRAGMVKMTRAAVQQLEGAGMVVPSRKHYAKIGRRGRSCYLQRRNSVDPLPKLLLGLPQIVFAK